MKKGIAIICFCIFLVSQTGYIVYQYLLSRSEKLIENRIQDHDYQESYLLELKVPLHVPYYLDQKDYTSRSGEIEWKGRIYNYVKSKVHLDTLYLLCLPNEIKTELVNSGLKLENGQKTGVYSQILNSTFQIKTPFSFSQIHLDQTFYLRLSLIDFNSFLISRHSLMAMSAEKLPLPYTHKPKYPPKSLS